MSLRWKPFYGWWVLLSAALVMMFGFALSAYALPVFYPELVSTFGWPRAQVALGGSLKTLLVGLLAPLNGWIIDRKGSKIILLAGVVTVGISFALLSGVHSLWQFYVLCLFLGAGGSWTHFVPTQLLIANWFAKRRGFIIGILTMCSGFGDAVIPLLSALFIKNFGWREACMILPVVLIVALLPLIFLVRNRPEEMGLHPDGALEPPHSQLRPMGHAALRSGTAPGGNLANLKTVGFWILATVFFLGSWAQFSVWQHLVLFLRDEGYSLTAAASLFSLFLASSTAGRFFSGPLSDRISAGYTMILGFGGMALATTFLISTHTTALIQLCIVAFGLGHGAIVTGRGLLVFEQYGTAGVGKLYGVATAMMTTGAFFGPVLAGYVHDTTASYNLAFNLAVILMGVSIVLVVFLRRSNAVVPSPAPEPLSASAAEQGRL